MKIKKLLSLVLSLAMLFALCACTSSSDNESSAPVTDSKAPAVVEGADGAVDEIENTVQTREVKAVGGIVPSTDIPILNTLMTQIGEFCEQNGIDFQFAGAMFDVTQVLNLLENYTTMGMDIVVMIPMDTEVVRDAALAAEAAGTHVVFVGSVPDYADSISGCVYSDYYGVGYLTAKMACAWAREKYPDAETIKIAATVAEADKDSISRTTGFRDAIAEDEVCEIVYEFYNATTVDDGYSFAEEAMTAQPEVRVFVMYESDPGIGADNFLQAYIQSDPSLSLDDFGVFAVGYSDVAQAAVDASVEGASAFRGIGCYSAPNPGDPVVSVIEAIINGDELPVYVPEDCYTVNSFGFDG